MTECVRSESIAVEGSRPDEHHMNKCRECRDTSIVHAFFARLANADDLSPSLPDPKILMIKADLMRSQLALQTEGQRAQWLGAGIWVTIAISWLVVITWKLGEIQSYLEGFSVLASLSGAAISTAILATVIGGLVGFTAIAVAVHSVLAEL